MILRSYRQGFKNSKEIGKSLGMDHKEIESQSAILRSNGYLTNKNKLTSKAMELIGA